MGVLYRFVKQGGHWAEIRERESNRFPSFEFHVVVDGSLLETEMFDRERLGEYNAALQRRVAQFTDGGWVEHPKPSLKPH